jgi:hypothetical protein
MPMCQSPKTVNVLIYAKRPAANDNCPLAETGVKSFQAGYAVADWRTFLGLLCVSVLLLVQKLVALGVRRIL